jgi:hypothetical protein
VVATTSGGVAATLGYADEEGAPADEMLAAAARIARGVEVPVTVDAEAGYGMQAAELVAALIPPVPRGTRASRAGRTGRITHQGAAPRDGRRSSRPWRHG